MYISGVKETLETIHALGGVSYCTQGDEVTVGLASAIGGCGVKQVDLVSAYSSIARQGAYKPQSSIIEVKNSSGESLFKWKDSESVEVINAQSAYIISDILRDDVARADLHGRNSLGFVIKGVPTATKTGTSDRGGFSKDIWMVSYSPAMTMAVWFGNSDATLLKIGNSSMPGPIIDTVMSYAHLEVYASEGKYTEGYWYAAPTGIQRVGNELYPSWWNARQGRVESTLDFDRVSKKKATACTPESAKINLPVIKTIDPITKKEVFTAVDINYDATEEDDIHQCSDEPPRVSVVATKKSNNTYEVKANVDKGTFDITKVDILINGAVVYTKNAPGPYSYTFTIDSRNTEAQIVSARVYDSGLYDGTAPSVKIEIEDKEED
jgi:penicillin-binding protein 1A